jgi:hypothetical protein
MLVAVRGVLVLALVVACSFDHGLVHHDAAPPDIRPDMVITPTWAIDGMSNKGVPAAAFEWTEVMEAIGMTKPAPDHLWLMQESSGSLDDSIGTVQLMPQNGPSYQNAVTGWSRVAVGTFDLSADQGFITSATGNLNGTSYLLLVYVAVIGTPSAERAIMGLGANTDHRYVSVTPAPVFKGTGAGVTPTIGTVNPMASVHPVVLKINPAQFSYVVYTDQEKLTVNWTGTGGLGNLLMIGNAVIGAAPARYLYGALWKGASANATDADVKGLLQGLGWTVSGY